MYHIKADGHCIYLTGVTGTLLNITKNQSFGYTNKCSDCQRTYREHHYITKENNEYQRLHSHTSDTLYTMFYS